MKKNLEYELQKQVCRYLDYVYPNVLYMSDTIASCKLSMPQAIRNKAIQKQGFKCPDLIIFAPTKDGHALFIEFKIESPYKKGSECTELKKNEHIEGQSRTIEQLKSLGYWGYFAWSFDMAKDMIDDYLKS
jgi:hypothetical protein